jgi:hypothetical protein
VPHRLRKERPRVPAVRFTGYRLKGDARRLLPHQGVIKPDGGAVYLLYGRVAAIKTMSRVAMQ